MKQDEINAHVKASKSKTIKLYRGMASDVLNLHGRSYFNEQKKFLHWILALRSSGKMQYPDFLDEQVQAFEKLLRTERQHFTDDREIARSDAKKTIEDWRIEYNNERPTKPLGHRTPAEFARDYEMAL